MFNRYTLRRIIQFAAFIATVIIVWQTARFVAHAYCPYAVVCFGLRGLNPGAFFIFVTAIIAGIIIALSTIIIGRRFCGYICPLGTLAEYLNYLKPAKKKKGFRRVPPGIERYLRLGKYLLLLATAGLAFFLYGYIYYQLCPVMLISLSAEITWWGAGTLIVVFLGSIFLVRLWCRYLCPYAALMNCFQFLGKKIGIRRLKIYRNMEVCNDCRCYEYNCQMNIEITDLEYIEDFKGYNSVLKRIDSMLEDRSISGELFQICFFTILVQLSICTGYKHLSLTGDQPI